MMTRIASVMILASSLLAGCAPDDGTAADEAATDVAQTEEAVVGGLFTVQGFATPVCPPFANVGVNAFLGGSLSYNASNQTDFDFYVNVWQGIYDDKGHQLEALISTWNPIRANTAIWWDQTQINRPMPVTYLAPGDVTLTAVTRVTDSWTGQVVYTNAVNTCRFHVY